MMELAIDLARGAPSERNVKRAEAAVEEVRKIEDAEPSEDGRGVERARARQGGRTGRRLG